MDFNAMIASVQAAVEPPKARKRPARRRTPKVDVPLSQMAAESICAPSYVPRLGRAVAVGLHGAPCRPLSAAEKLAENDAAGVGRGLTILGAGA